MSEATDIVSVSRRHLSAVHHVSGKSPQWEPGDQTTHRPLLLGLQLEGPAQALVPVEHTTDLRFKIQF